jgi:phospholipid/cholesterol/gamma-HCH transport system permease protein
VAGAARWIAPALENGANVLYLQGRWRLAHVAGITEEVEALSLAGSHCVLDGSRLEELDTAAGFVLLHRLAVLGCIARTVEVRHMADGHARLLALVRERMAAPSVASPSRRRGALQRVGRATVFIWRILRAQITFVGRVAVELGELLRRPRLFRLKETVSQFEVVTLDAIPIVALVTFLIGVVFAYLLGVQAQRYGATIFVVDGVGLAICRELAPILVAVIVAGRSGAAFTAQIGSMKVQEETDAIRTLGLSPIQVLVVPRLVAIMAGLPLLVFVGDVAGVAGGMLIGALQLEISPAAFLARLHTVLPLTALVVGLAKAPVFAAFIALIACRMGLSVARDARSVGEHTTSTVVQSIVWVIVLDAVFAVALQRLGI